MFPKKSVSFPKGKREGRMESREEEESMRVSGRMKWHERRVILDEGEGTHVSIK
jgi:hypothetical protein